MYPLQAGSRNRLSIQRHPLSLLRTPHTRQGKTRSCEAGYNRMIITTARKPSSKTRTFCKHLGRFTGWEYVTRGKTSRDALSDEPFLLVGEFKGNPGSLSFFLNGKSILSIHVSVSMDKEIHSGEIPVIEGDSPLAIAFSKVTGLKTGEVGERIIRINDRIEFMDNVVSYIVLKIRSIRGEGIA